jgi:recombination protein RecT
MSESNKPAVKPTLRGLLTQENVKQKFQEILKENASAFTANLAVMVSNSAALSKCDPITVISAAVVSASLNLPLDPNMGFAYIVPYGDKAQFMIGYKGFVQLAMRSGQYKTLNVTEVYEGELISQNRITGEYEFDFAAKKSDKIIGYAGYFKLINGFEKTDYWPIETIDKHGKRFSQTYRKGFGLWKDDFNSMARKTVLKNLLSKWGILSVEMQNAVKYDQGVVRDIEDGEVDYVDNEDVHMPKISESDFLEKPEVRKPEDNKLL